jgi:hypothetical protein
MNSKQSGETHEHNQCPDLDIAGYRTALKVGYGFLWTRGTFGLKSCRSRRSNEAFTFCEVFKS